MANTLPAPTEGLVYTNPTTGKRMKFSDGCWKPIDYLPLDGSDSMQDTLWTPDQLINGNTLTADGAGGDDDTDMTAWIGYPSSNESNSWTSVAYGDGKFVAVSRSGSNRVMYSEDGINWTGVRSSNESNRWFSVAYGNGKFVAVSIDGSNRVMYSEDGINWTGVPASNESIEWFSVTYGAGKFVAVSIDGTNGVMYSEDGINWTGVETEIDSFNSWTSVTYGAGKFVAVSTGSRVSSFYGAMYSTDGINWTGTATGPYQQNWWLSVTYGNGKFVAVAEHGSYRFMYSEDGITWTSIDSAAESAVRLPDSPPTNETTEWTSVTYGAGKFVAVAGFSGSNKVMYSEDGINWTDTASSNEGNVWRSVTYGAGKFVAVAWSGTNGVMVLDVPEGKSDLYFNDNPVVVDKGQTRALATLLSTQSTKLGRTKYYQDSALPTGDSYDYPDGSLWYQPTSNNLHFYNDSDQTWVQL